MGDFILVGSGRNKLINSTITKFSNDLYEEIIPVLRGNNKLYDIVYINGKYYTVGVSDGYGLCYTSIDGKDWERLDLPVGNFRRILYLNGLYIVYGYGDNPIVISRDGISWEDVNYFRDGIMVDEFNYSLHDMVWTGEKYVVVGKGVMLTSVDGLNWHYGEIDGSYDRILFNNDKLLFISYGDTYNRILLVEEKIDGEWILRLDGVLRSDRINLRDVIWDGVKWVAIGYANFRGKNVSIMYTTRDGKLWSRNEYDLGSIFRICYMNGIYYVFSSDGILYSSEDLKDWEEVYRFDSFSSVEYDEDMFVVWGSRCVYVSDDGMDWRKLRYRGDARYYVCYIV